MWFQRQRIWLYFQICWWAIQKRFLFKAELHRGTAPTSSLDLWVMQSYYTPGIAGYEENKPVILDLYKHMFACEYFAKAKYKIVQSHLSRQEKRTCWNAVSELMGIAFKIIHIYIYINISTFVNKAWQLKREVLTQISCLHRKTWLMCPHIGCSRAYLHSQIQVGFFPL